MPVALLSGGGGGLLGLVFLGLMLGVLICCCIRRRLRKYNATAVVTSGAVDSRLLAIRELAVRHT